MSTLAHDNGNILPFTTPKPTASWVAVTPEVAARWLERNYQNRNLFKAEVDRYARDMAAGRWHLDGSPIRIATDGSLLDGQHRLNAIIKADVTLPMLVVRNVDPDAQSAMDTGRRRSAADALAMAGHKHYVLAAATARILLEVEAGKIGATGTGRLEVSHGEVIDCIDQNPDISDACAFVSPFVRRLDCAPSMVAYTYLIMRRISAQDAAAFWVGMSDKVGLREGDPVLALSERLAEARRRRERLPRPAVLSMIYRAWNARRDGKSLRLLKVASPSGGLVPIPKPH